MSRPPCWLRPVGSAPLAPPLRPISSSHVTLPLWRSCNVEVINQQLCDQELLIWQQCTRLLPQQPQLCVERCGPSNVLEIEFGFFLFHIFFIQHKEKC